MIKVLLIATGRPAITILSALQQSSEVELVGVVTQPDKPVGKGQAVTGGPVKQFLIDAKSDGSDRGIRTWQPEKIKLEADAILEEAAPDLVVVIAYGQILPDVIFTKPRLGAINIHFSMLPQLRGAVPVPAAILQGLETTGVTIQYVVKALDAGPIVAQQEVTIPADATTASMLPGLSDLSAKMLLALLPKLEAGEVVPKQQDESQATFCYESDIAKEKAQIKWESDVAQVERMVRAFNPWPVAWCLAQHQGKPVRCRIWATQREIVELPSGLTSADGAPVFKREGKDLILFTHDGGLKLSEVQIEGKPKRTAADYLFLAD